MKKFYIEVLIFSFILFGLIKVIKLSVPYYWGNPLLTKKVEYLKSVDESHNTFFIGSSFIYRHVNTNLFDEITGKKSFNLGCQGMYALESDYMLENFIESINEETEIYLQEMKCRPIEKKNLHSVRNNYFLDFKRTIKGLRYFKNKGNYKQVSYHISGFVENQLGIGQFKKIKYLHTKKSTHLDSVIVSQKGYYPLDQELKLKKYNSLKKRNETYLKTLTPKAKQAELKIFNTDVQEEYKVNKNVNIWILGGNPISNPNKYFDKWHYNSTGADEYTRQIANKSITKNKKNDISRVK